MLSPEESIATMKIQPGYQVVPVLTEPNIEEPVAIAWDGNGRMYVIEMRTYMLDADGTDKFKPVSRVSRHEDTNGDGVYDKHTIFADNLILPRMVLPLLDSVIIGETNTLDLKSYRDTDGDGVADEIKLWHEGGPRGGNLEHQPSGLIWNIDNWIYTTFTGYRLRYTAQGVITEPLAYNTGQWGLTQDNVGRMFYSTAGGEDPAKAFQQPIIYGQLTLEGEQADGFREVFPIDNVPDVQGGLPRVRDDNTLTQFTGGGGQSIYRGDALPDEWDGDMILCEPVGRLIRRTKVTDEDGRITVSNAYDKKEFIAATDPNFRPINSATGPDGCLYLVDMYRGIVQEANWTRRGSYLRDVIKEYELDKNIGRGRIYRVDFKKPHRGPQPRMLDETPAQLIKHLSHPNGWWRDEAQKLIILHGDLSVVDELKKLAFSSENPLERLHAFWTLEGLGSITPDLLEKGMLDSDPRLRAAAVRLSEPLLATETRFDSMLKKLGRDPSPGVVIQTMLSVNHGGHPQAVAITDKILNANKANQNITSIADQYRANQIAYEAERKKLEELRLRNKVLADSVVRGKVIYSAICITCHGENGKGHPSATGDGLHLAPPLAGSPRVLGHKSRLGRILLHGLIGPIDDTTYADGLMMPLSANPDPWIADVANFVRNNWGNEASMIHPADIANIRNEAASRIGPWKLSELDYYDPAALENQSKWKITTSVNSENAAKAIDGDPKTRWDSAANQTPGIWMELELPEPVRPMTLVLDNSASKRDYPRGYIVEVSKDGKTWSKPVAKGDGAGLVTTIEMDCPDLVQHLRITQTDKSDRNYWSVNELALKAIPHDAQPPVSMAESLVKIEPKTLAEKARSEGDPKRGAELFYANSISCAKCHDPATGPRLGPDLATNRDGVTDEYLVEALLFPSKAIHKDFKQVSVFTMDGLMLTGFPIKEDDDEMVIREPAGGKEIKILQDDIDEVGEAKTSAMPEGLVNQLQDTAEFSDLIRFLMEIQSGGEETVKALKPR